MASVIFSKMHAQDVKETYSITSITQEKQVQKPKKEKKTKDEYKVFGGLNFNELSFDSELLKPTMAAGWALGASYKRGRFFYGEIGATYNNSVYNLLDTALTPGTLLDGVFTVRSVDIPISFGVNFLSFVNRLGGLRIYASAVPSFTLGVGDNGLGISTDQINSFNFYGQAGVGVDVAFLFLEAGYKYGFIDLFENDIKSNPNQLFINLGFRF